MVADPFAAIEIAPFILGAARGLGVALFLPLGWDIVAIAQRLALAFGFGLGLPVESQVPGQNYTLGSGVLLSFLIAGGLLGWPLAFITDVAAGLGELLDSARGVMIAEILDPLQSTTSSHLSVLVRYAVWVCFLASGGMRVLINAIAQSHPFAFQGSSEEAGGMAFLAIVNMFNSGLLLIAPALGLFLACELAVALLTKVSSNISMSTEGAILKIVALTVFLTQLIERLDLRRVLGMFYV